MWMQSIWNWLERSRPQERLFTALAFTVLAALLLVLFGLWASWSLALQAQDAALLPAKLAGSETPSAWIQLKTVAQGWIGWTVTLALVCLVSLLIVTQMLARAIDRPRQHLNQIIEAIAQGQHDRSVPYRDYQNGAGQMARALETLRQSVHEAGDDHWVKANSSALLDAIRSAETVEDLARVLLSGLAPWLGMGHGAFFRTDADGRLTLVATYAMTQRKRLQTTFEPGEGLPGQCLRERKPIQLTLPSDHVRITSGLGESPASHVMAWPLVIGETVLAVVELASYAAFAPRQLRLLEELSDPLAATLQVLDRNVRTRELLSLAQTQSDKMQKQAAQLEEQAVEMEAQQAELREAEAWYRVIIDNSWDGILIVDGQGVIVLANPAADRLFGYGEGALVGTSVDQLVPMSVRPGHAQLRDSFFKAERHRRMGAGPELRGRRADGSEFALRAWLTPLPSRGARGRCVSVAVRPVNPVI